MKLGAKVPDEALFRPEFDRSLVAEVEDRAGESCETDELRRCPRADSKPFVGVMIADFGRVVCDCGAGEGEERPNGLARLGELFN